VIPPNLRPPRGVAYPLDSLSPDVWNEHAACLDLIGESERATHARAVARGLAVRNRAVLVGRDRAGRTRIVSPDYTPDIFHPGRTYLPRLVWLTDAHLRAAQADRRFRLAFEGDRAGWRWTHPGTFPEMTARLPLVSLQFYHAIAEASGFEVVHPYAFIAGGVA